MTNERAIELLHRLQDEQFDGEHGDERREALEMAVRALFSQQIVNDSQGLVNDCISRKWLMECVNEGWIKFDTEKDKNIYVHLVRDIAPSAQLERPEQPESAKEYCAECNHIEMCRWYPYEGCEFRSLPSAQPETHDKRTETHACDLINRQQAIDAVVSAMIDGADAELVEGVMELLPSAQPVNYGSTKSGSSSQLKLNNDLISRRQAIDEFWELEIEARPSWIDAVINMLNSLPSAQPERKKGKWINANDGKWNTVEVLKCSVCGEMDNRMYRTDNFCPNCGADMRGESE